MLVDRGPYSYRQDPDVPDFDDGRPVVFLDGDCVLCTTTAGLIDRLDRKGEFRICPVQTQTGAAVLRHYGLQPDDPATWLYLVDGQAHTSMDAVIRVGGRIGGPGRLLLCLRVLPRPLQDWLYRRIARNRYRLLGRTDLCAVAGPALRARLIE